ncbi:hypothetical protein LCGC14_2351960 [marine sediment metagenome]|uniref:Uncharacterized protein n=1 Tax=marine sediment metagenome TaxID=412755 RepID=A0A0F9C8Y5_9ZZZZ
MNGHKDRWDISKFVLSKEGKKVKAKPIDKHLVMEDSCNNSQGVYDSYEDAVSRAKGLSGKLTIYRLVEVARVESQRKVVRVRMERIVKKKARKK